MRQTESSKSLPKNSNSNTAAVVAVLALAAFFPFLKYFTSGVSFFTFHALSGLMALKHQIAHCFLRGEYPLWNPAMIGGAPFHSGIGILDPFLLPYLFLDGLPALLAGTYLALFCSGIFMYVYLRAVWKLPLLSSLAGGLFYLANPFFAATVHESPFMNPPVFLPLVFLFYELGLLRKQSRYFLAGGLALAFIFFSGNLESFYFNLLFFVSLRGVLALQQVFIEKSWGSFREVAGGMIAMVLASFCFMAVDLLPTLEMIPNSGRSANSNILQNLINFTFVGFVSLGAAKCCVSKKESSPWAPALIAVLAVLFIFGIDWGQKVIFLNGNLFYPDPAKIFLGGLDSFQLLSRAVEVSSDKLKVFVDKRFIFYIQPPVYLFTLSSLYLFLKVWNEAKTPQLKLMGIFTVLLVLFPFTFIPNLNVSLLHLDQIAYPRFMFAFFFLLSIFVALGVPRDEEGYSASPVLGAVSVLGLFGTLILFMPAFNPARFQILLNEPVSSAVNFKTTIESLRFFFHQNIWLSIFTASKYLSLLFLFISFKRRRHWAVAGFLAFFAIDLFAAWNFYVFQKPDINILKPSPVESEMIGRVASDDRIGTRADPTLTIFNFYAASHGFDLQGNLPFYKNLKTIEGATLNLSPSLFKEFWYLEPGNTYTPSVLNALHSKIYDLMGMKYLFSFSKAEGLPYRKIIESENYALYENLQALPRFYSAKHVMAAGDAEVKAAIQGGDWNPRDVTLVQSESLPETRDYESACAVVTKSDRFNSLTVSANCPSGGFLATTEAYHPKWKAKIDGKEIEVFRHNFYFRGVFVPSGTHEIRFYYDQPLFRLGAWISALSLIVLIGAFFVPAKAGNRPRA